MLYTCNLYNIVHQLYLNKNVEKNKRCAYTYFHTYLYLFLYI